MIAAEQELVFQVDTMATINLLSTKYINLESWKDRVIKC